MDKKQLNAQATKQEFVKSIHRWLMDTLDKQQNGQYKDCFVIEGASIMCSLPDNFFSRFDIPKGTKIEMKFVSKKN